MIDRVLGNCGPLFGPALLALSVVVWALGSALVIAAWRGAAEPLRRIDPLLRRVGGICTQVGLLGTVVGMIQAFAAQRGHGGLDPELTRALGLCFWTTAVGAFHALVANGFTLAAGALLAARERTPARRPTPRGPR